MNVLITRIAKAALEAFAQVMESASVIHATAMMVGKDSIVTVRLPQQNVKHQVSV